MRRFHTIFLSLLLLLAGMSLTSCREDRLSNDTSLRLALSTDTLSFDTVFTSVGSATEIVKIYNPNANALLIDGFHLDSARYFHINIDGETDITRLRNIEIRGGDSLYIFVRVNIDPNSGTTPLLVEDALHVLYNGTTLDLRLEAYGQNVHIIRSAKRRTQYNESMTFSAGLPYLIYDTLLFAEALTIEPGARLYMHLGASIYAYDDVTAEGTLEQPIQIRSDRLDNLFDTVPYLYAAGGWGGLFLINDKKGAAPKYTLRHVNILSGNVGLYCYNEQTGAMPYLSLRDSRIHNQAIYGLVLQNVDAEVINTEISNAASYCVYISGGTHRFVHSTIASYFRWTNVAIQSAPRDTVAAVYIDNLSKSGPRTTTSFINSVISGLRRNNLLLATPLPQYYSGEIIGCYLKADSLIGSSAHDNVYWHETDSANVFANDFYAISHRTRYYDFRLDSLSAARGIAIADTAACYPTDLDGKSRLTDSHPDAGCYEY